MVLSFSKSKLPEPSLNKFLHPIPLNSSLKGLDVKECPGGVAVGCYTYRIKDRM